MSLINDALRRAEADRSGKPMTAGEIPPSPSTSASFKSGKSNHKKWHLPVLLGMLLSVALVIAIRAAVKSQVPAQAIAAADATAPATKPTPSTAPAPHAKVPVTVNNRRGKSAAAQDDAPTSMPTSAPSTQPAATTQPAEPASQPAVAKTNAAAPAAKSAPGKNAAKSSAAKAVEPTAAKPVQRQTTTADYKVSAITLGPDGPTAIINGRFVQVGENIAAAKVTKITRYSVELEIDGTTVTLGM